MFDATIGHHDDEVGHCQRFGLVVGHEDRGDADPLLDVLQFHPHVFTKVRVQCRERLIKQKNVGFDHDGPGQRHPLLLPARQFLGIARTKVRKLHQVQRLRDAPPRLVLRDIAVLEAEGDVVGHRLVRKKSVVLKDDAEVAAVDRQVVHPVAADRDIAFGRIEKPRDHPQRGRLAATGRSQQRDKAALRDLQRHPVDGGEIAKSLDDVGQGDGAHGVRSNPSITGPAGRDRQGCCQYPRWTRLKVSDQSASCPFQYSGFAKVRPASVPVGSKAGKVGIFLPRSTFVGSSAGG